MGEWHRYTDNAGLRLHYLDSGPSGAGADSGPSGAGAPVVFVPGFGEEADEHRPFAEALAPRRVIVVDLRGRGRSDAPVSGYSLGEHVSDVEAIVSAAVGPDTPVHLVSYSRGTSYALGWALDHPDRLGSVTIGDYPARQIRPPEWFHDKAARRDWRGRPIVERMSAAAIAALLGEAVDIDLWDRLGVLRCPVQVVQGGAAGAMVDEAALERYRDRVEDLHVVCFDESGHDLWDPDPERFAATVRAFVDRVDRDHDAGA